MLIGFWITFYIFIGIMIQLIGKLILMNVKNKQLDDDLFDNRWTIINTLFWPINIGLGIAYVVGIIAGVIRK